MKALKKTLLALVAALLAYTACEVAYRFSVYYRMRTKPLQVNRWESSIPCQFDEKLGFNYATNSTWEFLSNPAIHVNNHGHVSPRDDRFERVAGECRIGVIGDSFTTSFAQGIPWPIVLEDRLNADSELKERMGVRMFKVVNAGRDATGIRQWPNVYQYDLRRYAPDLVIVSFITDDIAREFIWRNGALLKANGALYGVQFDVSSLPAVFENPSAVVDLILLEDVAQEAVVTENLRRRVLLKTPWTRVYPELLAVLAGHRIGLPQCVFSPVRIPDKREAARGSIRALQAIAAAAPMVLFLHNPVGFELVEPDRKRGDCRQVRQEAAYCRRLWQVFEEEKAELAPALPITRMQEYIPQEGNIGPWFEGGALSGHFSPAGIVMYAEAVHRRLREQWMRGEHFL